MTHSAAASFCWNLRESSSNPAFRHADGELSASFINILCLTKAWGKLGGFFSPRADFTSLLADDHISIVTCVLDSFFTKKDPGSSNNQRDPSRYKYGEPVSILLLHPAAARMSWGERLRYSGKVDELLLEVVPYISAPHRELASAEVALDPTFYGTAVILISGIKTLVLIGANTGLGFEAAKHFARMNPARLVPTHPGILSNPGGHWLHKGRDWIIDLVNFSSVIAFADKAERELDRLNILMENAGMMTYETKRLIIIILSLHTNNLGPGLLAIRMIPKMLETVRRYSAHPRVVIVVSDTHYRTKIEKDVITSPGILVKLSDSGKRTV
ncbi:uncharacterized protein BT62DRAFT_1012716 [Guyanagaster necrorhizus]|uniref:Uncharacterized protein n=1 Tax=Guyanagaster necrorhizus TaxID=856835 RepID=A0A9P8AM66_9AGAR|nr:uncharacterized protein BT62DRAFT_1012716 [Guyanagaster necrorhizus MCA 3950]KAG7440361.1 hypothetical protein BT62DRAFT_1012716 [Guyanagaster necrorhizus MCA 3950]